MSDRGGIPFDPECQRCQRLAGFLGEVRRTHPGYYSRPVPSFGVDGPRFLVVGLAPGLHGANATGRPFTGDYAGELLYRTLHQEGFSSAGESVARGDGLELSDCRITNAVRCVPPQNKPVAEEVRNCLPYLRNELASTGRDAVVLALGTIAHKAVISALALRQRDFPFAHGAEHRLPDGRILLDSYHCSRYNTQTRRLTADMFGAVVGRARVLLDRQG